MSRSTRRSRSSSADAPRSSRRPSRPPRRERVAAPPPPEPIEPPSLEPVEHEPEVALAVPERAFAERVPPPEPERPFPTVRRAIFFDVENTSRMQHIARVIDHLGVDRQGRRTDFVAVGNWRVIGHDTARLLAQRGAQLVHSAPSVGVRDWSDLRIAVAAGVWLAAARPGDAIEIVSDDRAFDAVGDVAASLGIAYRRLSYRGLAGVPREDREPAPVETPAGQSHARRRRRGGRGRRRGGQGHVSMPPRPSAPHPPREHAPAPRHAAPAAGAEPHTAPHDEIIAVVRDLIATASSGTITIDALANALKSRGFSRPPGSPRLITRLRRIREITINRAGVIALAGTPPRDGDEPARGGEDQPGVGEDQSGGNEARADDAESRADDDAEPEPDGNRAEPVVDPGRRRRRRSRRGGRRHRRSRPSGAPAVG